MTLVTLDTKTCNVELSLVKDNTMTLLGLGIAGVVLGSVLIKKKPNK